MSENIITFNVTNLVTIGIMGAIFFGILRLASILANRNSGG